MYNTSTMTGRARGSARTEICQSGYVVMRLDNEVRIEEG